MCSEIPISASSIKRQNSFLENCEYSNPSIDIWYLFPIDGFEAL